MASPQRRNGFYAGNKAECQERNDFYATVQTNEENLPSSLTA